MLYFSPGHHKRAQVWQELGMPFWTLGDIMAMSIGEKIQRLSQTFGAFTTGALPSVIMLCALFVLLERVKAGMSKIGVALGIVLALAFVLLMKHSWRILPFDMILVYFAIIFGTLWGLFRFYRPSNPHLAYLFVKILLAFSLYSLLVAFTLQVGGLAARAKLCYALVLFLIVWWLYEEGLLMLGKNAKKLQIGILSLCVGWGIFVLAACIDARIKWEKMLESIALQKAQGKQEIIVDIKTFKSLYRGYGDWTNPGANPNEWPNTSYAHYFGVEKFIAK
ncbi:hypothetical protein CQA44_08940 [Helicobacter sp. MIT 14-3879]|nr:hypothetical protein CQA44_08940 [Helicobacter sp. MIT 14-3879]